MLCLNSSVITIIAVKGVDYRCIIHDSKSESIHLFESSVLNGCGYIYKMHVKETNIKNQSTPIILTI